MFSANSAFETFIAEKVENCHGVRRKLFLAATAWVCPKVGRSETQFIIEPGGNEKVSRFR
jgi:hypothetical protein